jgi:hypothetical protein
MASAGMLGLSRVSWCPQPIRLAGSWPANPPYVDVVAALGKAVHVTREHGRANLMEQVNRPRQLKVRARTVPMWCCHVMET